MGVYNSVVSVLDSQVTKLYKAGYLKNPSTEPDNIAHQIEILAGVYLDVYGATDSKSAARSHTIADQLDVLLTVANDELVKVSGLKGLALDDDISDETDLLGKTIGDLQGTLTIDNANNTIEGDLYYIDDYTGFDADPDLQKGWFIVLHADVPDVSGVTYKLTYGKTAHEQPLDVDQLVILRISGPESLTGLKMTVSAEKASNYTITKTYDMSKLNLIAEA